MFCFWWPAGCSGQKIHSWIDDPRLIARAIENTVNEIAVHDRTPAAPAHVRIPRPAPTEGPPPVPVTGAARLKRLALWQRLALAPLTAYEVVKVILRDGETSFEDGKLFCKQGGE